MPLEWWVQMLVSASVVFWASAVMRLAVARAGVRRRERELARYQRMISEGETSLADLRRSLRGMGIDVGDLGRPGIIRAPGPWPPPPADAVARITGESEDLASTRCYPPTHELAPWRRGLSMPPDCELP